MMEDKNYLTQINEFYSNNNEVLEKKLNNINSTRKVTGYAELRSSCHRAFNSCVNCIKYLSKNNIDYINDVQINNDKIALIAWQEYVMKYFIESIEEIDKLEKYVNDKLQTIVNSPKMKSRQWKKDLYNKLVDMNPNLMRYLYPITKNIPSINEINLYHEFRDGIKYIDNYDELSEKIIKLDPDKNLIDAFLLYLDTVHKINKIQLDKGNKIEIWKKNQNQLNFYYKSMLKVLIKLNKKDDTIKLTESYLSYVKENELDQQEYLKQEYNIFKNNINQDNKIKSRKLKK